MTDDTASADAMHYTAAADGADLSRSVPDPVAHLDPAEAARVLELAEQIDADALAEATGPTCHHCGNIFDPAEGDMPLEFWCSPACQSLWQRRQATGVREVERASDDERIAERARFASAFLAMQMR